jgi:nucleotide-binding universal stress UspA family protein
MYRHILIATDGSEIARKAVDQGIDLASRLGARVTAVVVSETITGNILAGQPEIGIMSRTQEIEKAADAAAAKILAGVGEQAKSAGVACETVHLRNMVPAKGILETAEKSGSDLIVMGSQGWSGFARFFLGSQAVEVVSGSRVPVLVVR